MSGRLGGVGVEGPGGGGAQGTISRRRRGGAQGRGGGVEADGGERAAAQGRFGAVEEETWGRRMRLGRVVPGGEGGGIEVEAAAALRWRGGGAPVRARPRRGVEEEALRWRSGRRRHRGCTAVDDRAAAVDDRRRGRRRHRGSRASRGPAVEGRSEEEERTEHNFYTIEPLAPGENTTRCQKGPKAPVGRPPGANGKP